MLVFVMVLAYDYSTLDFDHMLTDYRKCLQHASRIFHYR